MTEVTSSLETATNIPFAEFTGSLIESVFETVLDVNSRQMEDYLRLVNEVSQTLTEFINNTKDDHSPLDILDRLDELPSITFEKTTEGEKPTTETIDVAGLIANSIEQGEGAPPDDIPADLKSITPMALTQLNENLNIPGIINSARGAVVDITGAISSAIQDKNTTDAEALLGEIGGTDHGNGVISYNPIDFETFLTTEGNADKIPFKDISVSKIYDAIAANISANKYALLQELVKLGMVRIVVDNGLLETAMTFESVTKDITGSSRSFKNKSKNIAKHKRKRKPSRLKRLFYGQDKQKDVRKSRVVNVSTYKERHLNSAVEKGTLMGRCVIHWHTDYLPVREA